MSAVFDGTNGITFNDGTKVSSANSLGMRNRIINGDMRIDQRNAGAAVTVVAGATYAVDRFNSNNGTATGTITGQQSTLGNSRSLKYTATVAVTDLTTNKLVRGVEQTIEAQNIFDLNGKIITISFKVETNWTGNLVVNLNNSDWTRSYVVDVAVVSGTNNVSVTIPLEAATVLTNTNGRGLQLNIGINNEGSLRTATTGSWIAGNFQVSTSSTQWAKTTGNFINVTEVQLEEGSVATPFERRPIGVELALCQRYLPVATGPFSGVSYLTTAALVSVAMPVPARVAPSGVIKVGSLAVAMNGGGSGLAITGLSFARTGTTTVGVAVTVASGFTIGQGAMLLLDGDSLQFTGCEL